MASNSGPCHKQGLYQLSFLPSHMFKKKKHFVISHRSVRLTLNPYMILTLNSSSCRLYHLSGRFQMCVSTPGPQHPRKLHNFTQPPLILCGSHGAILWVPGLVETGMLAHLFLLISSFSLSSFRWTVVPFRVPQQH